MYKRTEKCGCDIGTEIGRAVILYCPMHKSAEDLLIQLQRMVVYYEPCETKPEAIFKIKCAKHAIAKATGDYL